MVQAFVRSLFGDLCRTITLGTIASASSACSDLGLLVCFDVFLPLALRFFGNGHFDPAGFQKRLQESFSEMIPVGKAKNRHHFFSCFWLCAGFCQFGLFFIMHGIMDGILHGILVPTIHVEIHIF